MSSEDYIKQIFPIKCRGRNDQGEEVLLEPLDVGVEIYKTPASNTISSDIKCKYNTGGHGQRCKASYPEGVDKVSEGISCPYAFDIPYALDNLSKTNQSLKNLVC